MVLIEPFTAVGSIIGITPLFFNAIDTCLTLAQRTWCYTTATTSTVRAQNSGSDSLRQVLDVTYSAAG